MHTQTLPCPHVFAPPPCLHTQTMAHAAPAQAPPAPLAIPRWNIDAASGTLVPLTPEDCDALMSPFSPRSGQGKHTPHAREDSSGASEDGDVSLGASSRQTGLRRSAARAQGASPDASRRTAPRSRSQSTRVSYRSLSKDNGTLDAALVALARTLTPALVDSAGGKWLLTSSVRCSVPVPTVRARRMKSPDACASWGVLVFRALEAAGAELLGLLPRALADAPPASQCVDIDVAPWWTLDGVAPA